MTTQEPPTLVMPVAEDPVVRLDNVTKTYKTGAVAVEALRGVTLDVHRGQYVAIMGPSGSGKSTLMNILGCLDVLTTGRYLLNGHDVNNLPENDLADIRNKEIGFVFQQFNLLPSLSAWRNVELPLFYGAVPAAERKERAIDALERVGLGSRIHPTPGERSGGQQQRVAVARALASEPAMILADEPTGNLDSASTEDVLALFDELHETGRTVVLITHEPDVGRRAQRMVHVLDGRITDPAEVGA